jgi:hypothetical protein
MKQIWPNYSYSPTTNVLTLTGLNIDRDQLLLVSAPERGRIMYNFADSTVTASAFTAGANTGLTLVASTAGLTTTAALVIYYDDQVAGISGTVTANLGNVAGTHLIGTIPSSAVRIGWGGEDTFRGAGIDSNGEPLPIQIYTGNSGGDNVTTANPLPISGTVTANPSISSAAITSGSFTSLTSATLVPANTARKMATVFNQGAGQLFINAGASATTLGGGFMVALNSGDFYECNYTTTTLSAIYATAGTASWMSH